MRERKEEEGREVEEMPDTGGGGAEARAERKREEPVEESKWKSE